MKIVHIAPNAPYNDYWGYQENLLPKYQRKLGHEVTVIITNKMHKDGKIVDTECKDYILNDGVRIIRRQYQQFHHTLRMTFIPVFEELEKLQPDLIFYHGLISATICDVVKYKKHHSNCVIVEDNHLDYNIGYQVQSAKDKLRRKVMRILNKYSIRYVDKVYGVTPWRKQYAEDYFKIPSNKTDVLIMGADDEKIDLPHRKEIGQAIKDQYSIADDVFLIVTGGKIDRKKNIDLLMKSVEKKEKVKLLVFGAAVDEFDEEFKQSFNDNVIYIGWIQSEEVYNYYFAADLVVFPGQHSVLWEQACASKAPCVFKKWNGMEHVNNGGNAAFIPDITVEQLSEMIDELHFTEKYYAMKMIAESEKTDIYLYSDIAKKSIECAKAI